MSPLLLGFNTARPQTEKHFRNPFVFSGVQFYSHPQNTYLKTDNLHVHFQLLDAPENLLKTGMLKYVLMRDES